MFSLINFLIYFILIALSFVLIRLFLYRTALSYVLKKWIHSIEDTVHVHQFFKVPEFNENEQQNQFYRKVLTYVNSLSSIEDSDYTCLFAGKKSNDILLSLDDNQIVQDDFLGARVSWKNEVSRKSNICRTFVLRIKKKDKRRILRPYLQHIHTVSDEIEQRRREVNLFINNRGLGRWSSVPFRHPSTIETVVMDSDLKSKVKSDLESFLKSKQYYHRLGRVWKKSYLLYGPSGTGKSSFVAAMAKFLSYDVYDVDLSRISDDSDLKKLLLQTTAKSLIVIEDLDRFLNEKSKSVSLSGFLNFMDGILNSCSSDEKIMVFTMNFKDQIDPAILRPGRIDVQIYFPLCDFNSFKHLANNYLGLKEHKLFPQVEEVFQNLTAGISPAEVCEIMIANRGSPSRAIKSVMTALQTNVVKSSATASVMGSRLVDCPSPVEDSGEQSGVFGKDIMPVKEFRKLYGLWRSKTSKKIGPFDDEPDHLNRS
ncbi:AAA-ATPase At2g46620-like [Impatiens glandulifera]|uniref:AAA-ATPase At2g46620-like n=1 Tax=Impatiens glandulifera TaxID=253017 RepID=UPI001FB178EF|nr:AAA-ATPase At2g46620-like [Impatiens glandulifera]